MSRPNVDISARAAKVRPSQLRELMKLIEKPGMISFAGGIPAPELLDAELFGSAYHQALSDSRRSSSLQYIATEGVPELRKWIAKRLGARGVKCDADNVLITSGSQQALDLIGKLLIDPLASIATERPTYLGALQAFGVYEPRFTPLRASSPDAEAAVYVVPDFANPTGLTMSSSARRALLQRASLTRAAVIEDAAYTDLRFEGRDELPLSALVQELDHARRPATLYCGTFSKTLAPGIRVGWVIGPKELIKRMVLLKQAADLHTSTINQLVALSIAERAFDETVHRAKHVYHKRRDAMVEALQRWGRGLLSWTTPKGGLFIWAQLPQEINAVQLFQVALAEGVAFVPGTAFFPDGAGRNFIRLSYSLNAEPEIARGIEVLCRVIGRELTNGVRSHRLASQSPANSTSGILS